MKNDGPRLDLARIRERLEKMSGGQYWRSLEQLADTEEFRDFLENEFPQRGEDWRQPANRRDILRLMGASLAFAGLSACVKMPNERIVPYVKAPEEIVPGKPLSYATAMEHNGGAIGLLVTSYMGRPTKVEGNPGHPGSLGATDLFAQASILTLYDPDRSRDVLREGELSNWNAFAGELNAELNRQKPKQGAGMRILSEIVLSPTLGWQMGALLAQYPRARWHQYEPAAPVRARRDVQPLYRFDRADVVLSLDADFLATGPGAVRYSRDFMDRRRMLPRMNRLYAVETMPSPTGSVADHRLPLRASEVYEFAAAVAAALGAGAQASRSFPWVPALVKDLQAHRGSSVVVAGDYQPPEVHVLAAAMNQALGNVGSTIVYTAPVEASPVDPVQSIREFVNDLNSGTIDFVIVIGGNPVFNAPADLDFTGAFSKVRKRVHLSEYYDETSDLSHWHLNAAHYLESWGDTRAYDGTATIQQPLIAPLYGGRTAYELISTIMGNPDASAHGIVRQYWQTQHAGADFEAFWRKALNDGVVPNTASEPKSVTPPATSTRSAQPRQGLEIVFRPDPTIWDGRFANNGWLQELPKPETKLMWDSVAHISPTTAEKFKLTNGDLVELKCRGRAVPAPVFITPGHANDSVTVHFGNGRKKGGRVAKGTGFDAYPLRTSDAFWSGSGLEIRKLGDQYKLASMQHQFSIEGRDQVRSATLAEFQKDPQFAQRENPDPNKRLTLYPEWNYTGYAWGMSIDLNACTGCSACVVACVAENNIAVVGKDQVGRGRAMHWLRIDRYYKGSFDNPEMFNEPMLCQHCETAPCELVCPVNATVHSSEGLSQMVYNRCVGTRYCSNNCPYKVRRFNFLRYSDWETPSLYGVRNPNVTVRSRGVMEKCSFCIQRINAAKIEAEKEDRFVRDGEIQTACQQACPTRAIVFGNINDRSSEVARLKAGPRNYGVLGELNTRPRVTYLAAVRNPNPEIEKA